MATHSSILAWRIPWTEEPGGLQSMGLQRVRHDRVTCHLILLHILRDRLVLKDCWVTFLGLLIAVWQAD